MLLLSVIFIKRSQTLYSGNSRLSQTFVLSVRVFLLSGIYCIAGCRAIKTECVKIDTAKIELNQDLGSCFASEVLNYCEMKC